MSKPKRILLLITLMLSNLVLMTESIMTPTVTTLYTMFPNGTAALNFAISGCYIVSIVMSLIIGKLTEKFSKKTLLTAGAVLGTIGACGMMYWITPIGLAVSRGIGMLAYAVIMTPTIVYINELFDTEAERGKWLGFNNAIMTLTGTVYSFLSGILATQSLNRAYMLHFAVLLYLVMAVFFIPSAEKDTAKADVAEEQASASENNKLGARYWVHIVTFSIFTLCNCILMYFISMYVAENALGSEALSGTLSSVFTIAGFFVALVYTVISKVLGKKLPLILYIIAAADFVLLMLAPGKVIAFVGMAVMGAIMTLLRVYYYAVVPELVPSGKEGSGIAFIEACTMLAVMVTTYIVTYGMQLLGMDTFTSFLIVPAVLAAILAAIQGIFFRKLNP